MELPFFDRKRQTACFLYAQIMKDLRKLYENLRENDIFIYKLLIILLLFIQKCILGINNIEFMGG